MEKRTTRKDGLPLADVLLSISSCSLRKRTRHFGTHIQRSTGAPSFHPRANSANAASRLQKEDRGCWNRARMLVLSENTSSPPYFNYDTTGISAPRCFTVDRRRPSKLYLARPTLAKSCLLLTKKLKKDTKRFGKGEKVSERGIQTTFSVTV